MTSSNTDQRRRSNASAMAVSTESVAMTGVLSRQEDGVRSRMGLMVVRVEEGKSRNLKQGADFGNVEH